MIWFGIGVVITVGTYAFAVGRGGGTYLVSYGPMIVGVVCVARGAIDVARQRGAAGPVPRPADRQAASGQAMATSPGYAGYDGYGGYGGYDGYGMRSGVTPDAAMPGTGMSGTGAWTGNQSMAGTAPGAGAGFAGGAARQPAQGSNGNAPWEGFQGGGQPVRPGYSQAVPANAMAPQPNWYPDPQNPAMLRWWDGQIWTNHTRPAG
jgi:hypothetical protein